ncbi:hypothetical protein C0J52_00480 [Blattella germanica]|nr:hypothetical protein C0J52_00480 [Blattella germanica]
MDSDSSVIHQPEIQPTDILNEFNMNCKAAEDLAIETVTLSDTPFIGAFRELTRGDCWQVMLKSIMYLLRHSVKRLPYQYRKYFTTDVLRMGEKCLERVKLRHDRDNDFRKPKQKQVSEKSKTHMNKSDSILIKNAKPTLAEFSDNSSKVTNLLPSNKSCEDSKNKVPKTKVPKTKVTKTKVPIQKVKRTLDIISPPTVDLTSVDKPKTAQKRKYTSDITKYVLKDYENKHKTPEQKTVNFSSKDGKENLQTSKSTGSEIDIKLKEPVNHTTPTGKLSTLKNVESPAKKKRCLEDDKSGRVNAFELMMKQSRANKGQNIKRKSLFP